MPPGLRLPPPICPIGGREIEKRREPRDPLFHELAAVDEHQRIGPAGGDDGRGDGRLAEPGRRREHAGLVRQQCIGGGLLFRGQASEKRGFNRTAGIAFVAHGQGDAQFFQQTLHRLAAAARQGDVVRKQLGAGDDARDAEGGASHRLGAVEGRVLEGRKTDEPVDQARRQAGARDVDLVAQNRVDPLRQRSGNLGQRPAPRRRRAPGLVVLLVERQTPPDNPALPAGLVGDGGRLVQGETAQRRQERPLVGMGIETVVQEDAVAALPWAALQRQRNEIAEAAGRHGVLAREEPVVGLEPDIRVELHRLGDQMGAETAREGGGHRLGEEDPDMRAIARTRALESRRHVLRAAGFQKGARVPLPARLVEVGGENLLIGVEN